MQKLTPPKGTVRPPRTPVPPVTPVMKPPVSKRRQRLRNVNAGCGVAIFPLMLLFGAALNITLMFTFPILIIGLIAVPFCFHINEESGKGKWALILSRVLVIGMLAVTLAASVICISFSRTPLIYPLKRLIYAVGVKSYESIDTFAVNKCMMPETLPDECRDYYFVTEQALHGPEGPYPNAYLYFRTDTETLKQYAEKLDAAFDIKCLHGEAITEITENESTFSNQDDWLRYKYKNTFGLPDDVTSFMLHSAGIRDDLTDAYYYMPAFIGGVKNYYGSGVLIDYETGLFLAWD